MKLENFNPPLSTSQIASVQLRREYLKPRLIKYGDVAKLTAGSAGTKGDGGTMVMS